MLVTAQPIGRPKPDLAERLRRLDVDEGICTAYGACGAPPSFVSPELERPLRPLLNDLDLMLRAMPRRFGLDGGAELQRRLALAR